MSSSSNKLTTFLGKSFGYVDKRNHKPEPEAHNNELNANRNPRSLNISIVMRILVYHVECCSYQPEDDTNNNQRMKPLNIGLDNRLIHHPGQSYVNGTNNKSYNHVNNMLSLALLNVVKECK